MEETFQPDPQAIACGCVQPLAPLARRGLVLFNAGQYFEAHEELELAWREETGPVRELYRGILQVGVAYHHILRGNYRGAVKMFARAWRWLAPLPANCQGVDVARFLAEAQQAEAELLRLGPERLSAWNPSWMKPVHYTDPEETQ